MSRSFRESYRGRCYKPMRSWFKGYFLKPVRGLKKKLKTMRDEEGCPIIPKLINRKLMGCFCWHVWTFPEDERYVVQRNRRKYMLKKKDFKPYFSYYTPWRVIKR